jgi:WD40 repeat protein
MPEDDAGDSMEMPDANMVIVPSDASGDAPPTHPGFFLLSAETPGHPATDGSNWGGISGFHVSEDFAKATPGGGLSKNTPGVQDPLGLAFRWKSAELFITNRGGNLTGNSSIARFKYDNQTHTFSAGTIIIQGYSGLHGLTFNPTEDELFVGTNNEGMRRFKLTNQQWVEQPQPAHAPDWIRGVSVSPDGKRLYGSTAGPTIRIWDLTNNTELPPYTVADPSAYLHYTTICGPAIGNFTVGCSPAKLYVSDAHDTGPRAVYVFDIDKNGALTNETKISANPTFSAALSPDTLELFSGGSTMDSIQRFKASGKSWIPEANNTIATNNNLGMILVFPENAAPLGPN